MSPLIDRGLDLSNLGSTSPDEFRAFREFYQRTKGYALPAFEFWAEFGPEVLKRYRMQAKQTAPESIIVPLSFLHLYAVIGYPEGVLYEIRNAQAMGATRAQILETIAVAFLHAGPRGMQYVATSSQAYLASYEEQATSSATFPAGWEPDPLAFQSGLDFSDPGLTRGEFASLERWYQHYLGEIPRYVTFLAEVRPTLLKAYRSRFENSIRTALPKQMMPYLMIHLEVARGSEDGIREGVLLARGFGLTKTQAVDAMAWAFLYGGPAAASIAERAMGEILRAWSGAD